MKKFVFLFLILPFGAFSQTGAPLLTAEQLKSDFQLVADVIQSYHPSCYRFVSQDSMQRSVAAVLADLNAPLSESEFQLVVRRFLTQVHCGHTVAMPSVDWYNRQRGHANFFPFMPLVVGDGLYLPGALASDSLSAGSEIVSINDRNATDILNAMRAIHTRDGFSGTFTDHSVQGLFQTYYLFLYGSEPEYAIVYRNKSGTHAAVLKTKADITRVGALPRSGLETYRVAMSTEWSDLYINDADSMAVLQIRGFGRGHFKKYYKKVFRELERQQIPNLVIDMRDNGGGYFPNGNRLLRYLSKTDFTFRFSRPKGKPGKHPNLHMDFGSRMTRSLFGMIAPDPVDDANVRTYEIRYKAKTKQHYDGRLYVLINGGSFSMSGYVAAFLQHHTDALLIGQETGGGEEGSNAVLFYKLTLPASGIRVNVPYYHLDHQLKGVASERGVVPDITVKYSLEDLLNGTDQELKTVLSEVRKSNAHD